MLNIEKQLHRLESGKSATIELAHPTYLYFPGHPPGEQDRLLFLTIMEEKPDGEDPEFHYYPLSEQILDSDLEKLKEYLIQAKLNYQNQFAKEIEKDADWNRHLDFVSPERQQKIKRMSGLFYTFISLGLFKVSSKWGLELALDRDFALSIISQYFDIILEEVIDNPESDFVNQIISNFSQINAIIKELLKRNSQIYKNRLEAAKDLYNLDIEQQHYEIRKKIVDLVAE